jgi:hypothetical protein
MEGEPVLVEVHLSEARLTNGLHKEGTVIPAGSRTICHAESNIILDDGVTVQNIHTKLLDTCGSVSVAHSSYLIQVKGAREHNLPPAELSSTLTCLTPSSSTAYSVLCLVCVYRRTIDRTRIRLYRISDRGMP